MHKPAITVETMNLTKVDIVSMENVRGKVTKAKNRIATFRYYIFLIFTLNLNTFPILYLNKSTIAVITYIAYSSRFVS